MTDPDPRRIIGIGWVAALARTARDERAERGDRPGADRDLPDVGAAQPADQLAQPGRSGIDDEPLDLTASS